MALRKMCITVISERRKIHRLRNYWDKLHPECNFLSDKNVRDQASRIEELRQLWEQDMELLQ